MKIETLCSKWLENSYHMVSEIKERWVWVGECFMENVRHVVDQEALYEIEGNRGHFRWGNSLGHAMMLRTRMVV